jgi:hypothetical protein
MTDQGLTSAAAKTSSPQPRSIKDVTLGQLGDVVDLLKKFWAVLAAAVLLGYGALTYFATASALHKLACQSERRPLEERQRSAMSLLNAQKTDLVNQQVNLLNLKALLLEIQVANPSVQLSPLKDRMDKIIDAARIEVKVKDEELRKAELDLKTLSQSIESCGSKSS